MSISDVTFYEIPMAAAEMTAERVNALRNIILPTDAAAAGMVVYQSAAQWLDANAWGPLLTIPADASKPTKMWAVRASVANVPGKYLRVALDTDGKVRRYSVRPGGGFVAGANPVETAVVGGTLTAEAILMQGVLGLNAMNFLAEWGGWFPDGIPLLEWVEMSADEAKAVNFGNSQFVQIPLGAPGADPYHVATWPQGYIPCFHPVSGRVSFFKIDEFVAKVSKKPFGGTTAAVGFSATDAQVGALARTLVQFSVGITDDELGKRINAVARAK